MRNTPQVHDSPGSDAPPSHILHRFPGEITRPSLIHRTLFASAAAFAAMVFVAPAAHAEVTLTGNPGAVTCENLGNNINIADPTKPSTGNYPDVGYGKADAGGGWTGNSVPGMHWSINGKGNGNSNSNSNSGGNWFGVLQYQIGANQTVTLFAGQTTPVGKVEVTTDHGMILVKYTLDSGADWSYVATDVQYNAAANVKDMLNNGGNLVPGIGNGADKVQPGQTEFYVTPAGSTTYIFLHLQVTKKTCE
jgi:hypothetical protein